MSLIKKDYPVCQKLCLFNIMGSHENGGAGSAYAAEDAPQRAAYLGIETGGGFVQEKNFRRMHEGPCQNHAPLLASGELFHRRVRAIRHPGEGEKPVFRLCARLFRHAEEAAVYVQVLADGKIGVEIEVLARHTAQSLGRNGIAGYVYPREEHAAAVRSCAACQDPDGGRFACAVGAEAGNEFPPVRVKADVVQHFAVSVAFAEMFSIDHGLPPASCVGESDTPGRPFPQIFSASGTSGTCKIV